MTLPNPQSMRDQRDAAELSWAIITPHQIREKIANVEAVPGPMRAVFARMLAHAIATHAPQHLGLLPPKWIAS